MTDPHETLRDIAATLERIEPPAPTDDPLIPVVREVIGDMIRMLIARQRGQNGMARAAIGEARQRMDELHSRVTNEKRKRQ